MAATGQECIGLPVISREWVNKNDSFVSCSRNLPPVGTRVFVLMPTGTIAGAFVLCSGYTPADNDTHTLFEENKETESKKITCGGWTESEDYATGNKSIKSKDENIEITLTPNSSASITAFNHSITIDSNGITINSDEEININTDKDLKINAGENNVTLIATKFAVKNSESATENALEVSNG